MADTTDTPMEQLGGISDALEEQASTVREHVISLLEATGVADWVVRPLSVVLLLGALFLTGWLTFAIARPLVLRWMRTLTHKTRIKWDDELFGHGFFRWMSHLVPALLIHEIGPGLFRDAPTVAAMLTAVMRLYILVASYMAVDSLLNAGRILFRRSTYGRNFPIGSFVQLVKLLAFVITFILGVSILIGRSPAVLLSGIGIFASVLMLVFKDAILGFVAGIQLASNRMVAPGDWIEMPSQGADGDVVEVGLTTVKLRNFDNTITTIPSYAMITGSFKNWRGMSESSGRRIKRSLHIDLGSVKLCDEEMLSRFEKIEFIGDHLRKKRDEVAGWNRTHGVDGSVEVNGRRLTNIGTFRAYVLAYLRQHPEINQDLTVLVRQRQPTDNGLPIEIYCFTRNKAWLAYEDIQSDIFDHLIAVVAEFELRIFQDPGGADIHRAWGGGQ